MEAEHADAAPNPIDTATPAPAEAQSEPVAELELEEVAEDVQEPAEQSLVVEDLEKTPVKTEPKETEAASDEDSSVQVVETTEPLNEDTTKQPDVEQQNEAIGEQQDEVTPNGAPSNDIESKPDVADDVGGAAVLPTEVAKSGESDPPADEVKGEVVVEVGLGEEVPAGKDGKGEPEEESEGKLIPIWRLFRYADCWDILMILVGAVLSLISGVALPLHNFLFGQVVNEFIFYTIATNATGFDLSGGSCANQSSANASAQAFLNGILLYTNNPGPTLQNRVGVFSGYYAIIGAVVFVTIFFSTVFWNVSANRQTKKMRVAFYRSILSQEMGWFDVNDASELNTRLVDDIEKIQAGIGDKIGLFLQYCSTFVTGFVIAFTANWKLALVLSVTLPILCLLIIAITQVMARFTVREQKAYAAAGAVAEEVLSSIRTVVAFAGEAKETERYGDKLKKARAEALKKAFFGGLVAAGIFAMIFLTYALGFGYGSTLIISCELSTGDIIIVLFSVIIGSFSLGNALPEIETIAIAIGSATIVYEVIDRDPLINSFAEDGARPEQIKGNISLKDVQFHYPSRPDVQILRGLNLNIPKGHTVAFVGPSGCGKSTVMQLIQRLYDPVSGVVTIDGHDVKSLNLRWLRNNIGIVSQEPALFNDTIAGNIRYGKKDATMEEVIEAAKNANAHNFISELPDGYDTHVGERGAQLSGGQKQRIAIARALVRNPKVLLLDEATSALDTESEKTVQDALDKAREGRTTIVIAHRLSTIQTADIIVAIEKGRVVEMGSHSELMDKEGLYHELVNAQTIATEKDSEQMADFKDSVHKSINIRRKSSATSILNQRRGRLVRQQTVYENIGDIGPTRRFSKRRLSENISRFTTEDIPFAAVPSAFPGRSAFAGQEDILREIDDAEEEEQEEEAVAFEGEEVHVDVAARRRSSVKPAKKVTLFDLLKLNKPEWLPVLVGVIGSGIMGAIFPLMSLVFSEVLLVLGQPNPEDVRNGINIYIIIFCVMAVVIGLIQFISSLFLSVAGERLTTRLRLKSFEAMLRQNIGWFDKKTNSTGALITKLASDASEVKGATGIRLGAVLQQLCGFAAAIIVSFTANWELTLLLMVAFPILIVFGYIELRLVVGRSIKNKKKMENAGQIAVESIENIRTVVALAVEPRYIERYEEQIKGPFRNSIKNSFIQGLVLGLTQGIIYFLYAAGFAFGAFLIIERNAAYNDIFLVFSAIVFTALSVGRASTFAADASKAKNSAKRIFGLIQRKPPIDSTDPNGEQLSKVDGGIDIRDVHFHYPERPEVKILQGLSISVKSGQTLAFVGPSGCGKSTSISLIERFYNPNSGCLTLDGVDLCDLNIKWLRSKVGIVSQEPTLFDATIAENIRYGALDREVSDEEVIEAAKASNIHSFIETLPNGYNTNVGAKGTQLSGGQKQRIAIARALVRDPKILLLDEATSALDTESEKIVQEALDKAREGRTSIVIAHRLSTIYNSDVIAVIHKGQVIESGTHSELMAKGGAYYHLNTVQQKHCE